MNIKEAKDEIKKSVEIYLDKNEFGEYTIPASKQRPIFLVGAPGIGKSAAARQTASELDIAFVSCSMAHYTQQSVLGRPVIKNRAHDGKNTVMSGYTMSEIIAAVHKVVRDSGKKEGILFLNEINCVSEELASDILLFLRDKTFGEQRLPAGWVVVTAGNPPQYNKSVNDFDVAAIDRLKRIDITEDFFIWKEYAYQEGIHAAVTTFLEINRQWFYSIRFTLDGMRYVTARGWEDLSTAIRLYEKKGFVVDRKLIAQYITDAEIAERFADYYDLYRQYRDDHEIADILSGKVTEEMVERFLKMKTDERFSILGLFMEILGEGFRKAVSREHSLRMTVEALRIVRKVVEEDKIPVSILVQEQADQIQKQLKERTAANIMTGREREEYLGAVRMLEEYRSNPDTEDFKKDFEKIEKQLGKEAKLHEKQTGQVRMMWEAVSAFVERIWGDCKNIFDGFSFAYDSGTISGKNVTLFQEDIV